MSAAALRRRLGRGALGLVAVLIAAVWVFPVYWMALSSLTPNARLRTMPPAFWPTLAHAVQPA